MTAPAQKTRARFDLLLLEERLTPATSGVAWPDGAHLTLSFAPDGTQVGNYTSTLFQTLNAAAPTAAWQREILRAFQAWAATANLNVGVVPDSGDPLGTTGAVQGDSRFGDIRIAAAPLAPGTLMTNTPFQWSGSTWSGDILVNSTYAFSVGQGQVSGQYDLFTAALDEAANVLGVLDSQTDTTSAVYYQYTTAKAGLDANDVADIQSLYGARSADNYDAAKSNDTIAAPTSLSNEVTKLNFQADITTAQDVDYYLVKPPANVASMTVNLVTSGLSSLTASLQVLDANKQVIGSAVASDTLAGNLAVQINQPKSGAAYYIRVAGNGDPAFGTGGYRVSVVYRYTNGTTNAPVDASSAPVADAHKNDKVSAATDLQPIADHKPDARFDFTYNGVVEDATDLDYYKFHAPKTAGQKLNVMVWALPGSALAPRVDVFDSTGIPVAATVLANAGGMFSVEVTGIKAGATYVIEVSALNPGGGRGTGAYFIGADFTTQAPTALTALNAGTLTDAGNQQSQTLTVGQNRLYEFNLSARSAQQWTEVRMEILDADGAVVFTLDAYAGMPVATGHVYLAAGTYTVRYTAATADGSPLSGVDFSLTGREVSDPIGVVTSNTSTGTKLSNTTTTTKSLTYTRPYYF